MESEELSPKKKHFFSWRILSLCALGLVLVAVPLTYWIVLKYTTVYTNDAQIDGYYVEISPDIMARIIQLEVDEGDFVKAGDLLVRLDESILQSEFVEKEAKVAMMKDHLSVQEAHFEKVRNDYERAVKGIRDQIISEQEFDHKEKDYLMAGALLEQAKSSLEHAITELGVVQAKLEHTFVFAPRNGYIAKRWVLGGDVMRVGQTMFSLYDLDNIWVLARLDETSIGRVHLGDPVTISIDAYPGVKFHGEVFVIKSAAASQFALLPQDNATGNYTKVAQRIPVKISVRPPEELKDKPFYLFPGMSAEVRIKVR